MSNSNDLINATNNQSTTAEAGARSNLADGTVSLKRTRYKSLSGEQSDKRKMLTPSNLERSTQTQQNTDEIRDALKSELFGTFKNKLESHLSCVICNEIYLDSCILPCGHIFCSFCIQMWLLHADTCPICRKTTEFVIATKVMDNFIQDTLGLFDETAVQARETLVNSRNVMLQKVETSLVVENNNSYHSWSEIWQDWVNMENSSDQPLDPNSYVGSMGAHPVQYPDTTETIDLTGSDERTNETMWPSESDEIISSFMSHPPPDASENFSIPDSTTPSEVIDADANDEDIDQEPTSRD